MTCVQTCHRCQSIEVRAADSRGRFVCSRCFWRHDGNYWLHRLRLGFDDHGRLTFPQIDNAHPIGVMTYVAAWPSYPPDMGLLACPVNTCQATVVGPIVGQPCPWCVDRGRTRATVTNGRRR